MKEILKVQGISCGHCVNTIEESVSGLAGVSAVKVELDSGEVSVSFDDKETTLNQIKKVIEDEGYEIQ